MSNRSYSFSHAIVRLPGHSILAGLRAVDTGSPSLERFLNHHKSYVAALESTGAKVTVLPPEIAFPDSVFVEDAALCLPEGAVIMRPGAPSRLGEAALIKPTLESMYDEVQSINGPGCIEGGDILTTEREILVGLSARTNTEGVNELRLIVSRWGYAVRIVETPADILHFKTDCSLLDEETILCTKRLAASGCFEGYRLIHTVDGEEACANAIRFNELVIMPDGFPQTTDVLCAAGYHMQTVCNTEAAKIDGGMSCLSLRFSLTH